MDSPHSDAPSHLVRLRESIRRDDWSAAESLAHDLAQCPLPRDERLGEYLKALKQTLIMARASRSNVAASLSRARAAARFQANRSFGA